MSASPSLSAFYFLFFLIVSRIKNSKQGAYFWGRHGQVGDALPLTKSSAATFPLARETPASVEGRLAACMLACWAPPIDRHTATLYTAPSAHGAGATRAPPPARRRGGLGRERRLPRRASLRGALYRWRRRGAQQPRTSYRSFLAAHLQWEMKRAARFTPFSRGALRPAKAVARRPPRPGRVRSL